MLIPDDPILHVGDRVRISCVSMPEICVERSVGVDGTLDVPTLGAFAVATRPMSAIKRLILDGLWVSPPKDEIEVRWLGPARGRVEIAGAVERSLILYAPRGVSRDRLLAAAHPQKDADLALLPNVTRIVPGSLLDVASATAARRISVLGAVSSPRSLPPTIDLVLSSAIANAGGLTAHADKDRVIVVRFGESIPVSLPADESFLLQPGDEVRVGTISDRRYVTVRGLVARPGTVEYSPRMAATQAIESAGGLLASARKGTLVWQTGSKTFRLSLAFILDRRIPDPILAPNDTIDVEVEKR